MFRSKLGSVSELANVGRYIGACVLTRAWLKLRERRCVCGSGMVRNALFCPI